MKKRRDLEALDAMADVVLAHGPAKKAAAAKRKRSKSKAAAKKTR